MKEKEIIKILKEFKPQPDKKWLDRTLNILNNLPQSVTKDKNNRISSNDLFNFLNTTIVEIKLKAGIAIAASVILIGSSVVTVHASNDANPGDFLYPLDKAVENFERTFITDPVAKSTYEMLVMDERVEELKTLSAEDDKIDSASAIGEVDAQQIRLQERLREMDQLRTENKLQTQDQLKVMEQLKLRVNKNEETMNQVQQEFKQNGNTEGINSLNKVQENYLQQNTKQIGDFETSTGLKVNEAEQNAGEDTQIQNQNQIQNGGTVTPANGNGSGSGNIAPTGSSQENGNQQQGKN